MKQLSRGNTAAIESRDDATALKACLWTISPR